MDQDTSTTPPEPDGTPITDPPAEPAAVPADPPPPTEIQQPPDGSAPVGEPGQAPAGPPSETSADVTRPGDPGYDDLLEEAERQQQRAKDLEGRS